MGYYTEFELEILEGDDNVTDYEQEISDIAEYNHCFQHEIKWYNYQENMIEYSKKHPDVLFLLSGKGEESSDLWREYFEDGKTYRVLGKVVFEDFKKESLKKL